MNEHSINQGNNDDKYPFGMRKISYWEIYGVKRFPYRGRRKFTLLLYQSFDRGMIISNDVFGLTIRQFERKYKACLDRRKKQEQWILNLRYPDKSSNDYIEYLQHCRDCNKDDLVWLGIDPREKNLYEHIVKTVGTELYIRKRQRLFILLDRIVNACYIYSNRTQISSGSMAEGLDLPGSDIDIMYVIIHADVIQNESKVRQPLQHTSYVMETDFDHPGFTRLKVMEKENGEYVRVQCQRCPPGTILNGKSYLSVNLLLDKYKKLFKNTQLCVHGPCLSNENQTHDIAFCLRSKDFPGNAIPWASRHRRQWPPNFVIKRIINYGCLLVPIGPKTASPSDSLWRLSFSVAEKILVHSFSFSQLLCYGLLKLTLKRIINKTEELKDLLCSYFLKTALFWVSEEVDIDTFHLSKIFYCFSLCLEKLISWVNICYCPNYFIPEHNMFLGKINQSNNKMLLGGLENIQCGGIDGLIQNLFLLEDENNFLLSTQSESSFIMLDLLIYKVADCMMETVAIPTGISNYNKALSYTEYLLKSESSTFIIDACNLFYAKISLHIAKLLPPPNPISNKYNIHKWFQRHIQDGIKTDAVSGWLLYASFYYITRQFNVTLKLMDYVLSKCSPDMLLLSVVSYSEGFISDYRHNVHSAMTLNERLTIATVNYVSYRKHSSLIPKELQLEVEDKYIYILPDVMCQCLRFLCYHHLGDIVTRRQALRDLYLTVKDNNVNSGNTESNELTILGVCFDISGEKDMAYRCFDEALQCKYKVCPSAKTRISKLFRN